MINSIKDFKESSIGSKVLDYRIYDVATGAIDWDATDAARADSPIFIDHEADMISFKMMTKPASEGGKGCQLTDLIEVSLHMLRYLNAKFPCDDNSLSITHLEHALGWQRNRTKDRERRGVEGKNES